MEVYPNTMTILNGSNYAVWKIEMEDLLYVNDCYQPVFSDEKPEGFTDVKWNAFHRQVCRYIRKWVDDSVLKHVVLETNARILWNKLEGLCRLSSKLFLVKQLKSIKYRDGTSMLEHEGRFLGIVSQLEFLGFEIDDETRGSWLLCTLPDSWEIFITLLCISAPNDKLTFDFVRNKLLDEEIRRKMQNLSTEMDATVAESRGRSKSKGWEKRQNVRSKSRGKYGTIRCYNCGEKGHIKRFCRKLKRDEK